MGPEIKAIEGYSLFMLRLVPFVWIPLAASAAWGLRLLIRGRRAAALTWFLWMTIAFTFIQGALFCRLFYWTF